MELSLPSLFSPPCTCHTLAARKYWCVWEKTPILAVLLQGGRIKHPPLPWLYFYFIYYFNHCEYNVVYKFFQKYFSYLIYIFSPCVVLYSACTSSLVTLIPLQSLLHLTYLLLLINWRHMIKNYLHFLLWHLIFFFYFIGFRKIFFFVHVHFHSWMFLSVTRLHGSG